MEDVLAVYTRPRDPDRLLVCLDETSKQLIAETRMPIPMKRGVCRLNSGSLAVRKDRKPVRAKAYAITPRFSCPA